MFPPYKVPTPPPLPPMPEPRPTPLERMDAWISEAAERAFQDAHSHPVGHANRSFYMGQSIAYENVLSMVRQMRPVRD